jgi:signal transduction histidine kinase
MLEEVDRLTRLVDSLLLLTRADSSSTPPAREVVELAALADNVAEHLRVLAEERQQSLSVHSAARVEAVCDPDILRLGLMNLLHNAIKYTPSGGAIHVRAKATASGESSIEVEDTGPGIPAAHRERIFERFYRADPGRPRESGGAGLGLAIARWAVASNGGRIELESEESKGSLFRIVLPALPREG